MTTHDQQIDGSEPATNVEPEFSGAGTETRLAK